MSTYLTTAQAAKRAGVSQRSIQAWIKRGYLPRLTALPNENRHFIRAEDLDKITIPQEHITNEK